MPFSTKSSQHEEKENVQLVIFSKYFAQSTTKLQNILVGAIKYRESIYFINQLQIIRQLADNIYQGLKAWYLIINLPSGHVRKVNCYFKGVLHRVPTENLEVTD